jgi:hypothetical protein
MLVSVTLLIEGYISKKVNLNPLCPDTKLDKTSTQSYDYKHYGVE